MEEHSAVTLQCVGNCLDQHVGEGSLYWILKTEACIALCMAAQGVVQIAASQMLHSVSVAVEPWLTSDLFENQWFVASFQL